MRSLASETTVQFSRLLCFISSLLGDGANPMWGWEREKNVRRGRAGKGDALQVNL